MMTRSQLEKWLGHPAGESEMRFALAVLRDVFPDDAAIRAWLRAPLLEGRGLAPADLISLGRMHEFADVAVTEWNRPRAGSAASGIDRFVIHGTMLA